MFPPIATAPWVRSGPTLICFDFETTGLVGPRLLPLDRQPRATEFAAIAFSMDAQGDGEEQGTLDFLINPGIPIPAELVRKIGISDADVAGQPRFAARADDIRRFLARADMLFGHNVMFDVRMLEIEFRRLGQAWTPDPGQRRMCSMEQAGPAFGNRVTLSKLHLSLVGTSHTGAHRAVADVRACIACLRALRRQGLL